MSANHHMDMLQGPLLSKLMLFALPLAASSILQQLFNSADMAVVGHFAGSQAMAAVGGNSAVINLLVNLFLGLSVGANVVIARYIGLRYKEKANESVHTVMTLALLSGVFLLFAGVFMARPILKWMDTPADVLDMAVLYLQMYFAGMPFFMLYNFGAAVLRSVGDTRRPLYSLILAGIVNVVLNVLFVVAFKLSVMGVALATFISHIISAALILFFLMREEDTIRLDIRKLSLKKGYLLRIFQIGAPAGLQGVVFSLSNVCIQAGINSFGTHAVAGSATGINFEYFSYFIISAFVQAAVTFTSQNYAACNFDRCRKIFLQTLCCTILFTALSSIIFTVWAEFFTRLYTSDNQVVAYSVSRIINVESLEWLVAFYEIPGAVMRGMGVSLLPAIVTLFGSCVFRIVWIYTAFQWEHSYDMLMHVYPVSWILMDIVMLILFFWIRNKLFRERGKEGACSPLEF